MIKKTKIIFKNENGSACMYCNSWGVYFEGESESFDTIFKAWREDFDIYGAGWTQINRDVRDIIGGCHVKCNDLKNAYREHADEIRKIIKQ